MEKNDEHPPGCQMLGFVSFILLGLATAVILCLVPLAPCPYSDFRGERGHPPGSRWTCGACHRIECHGPVTILRYVRAKF